MPGFATRLGPALAKALGIKLQDATGLQPAQRLNSSKAGDDDWFDSGATSSEWLRHQLPSVDGARRYVRSLFPFLSWAPHYNLQWLAGDVVSGLTIGAIVVPQGMAYASLAKLEPQFGLYSSFVGVVSYWIFGTSKDISIGNVAVLSSIVGSVVEDITSLPDAKDMPPHVIASALSVVAGSVVLAIGLLRCGWIVDLISIPSLSAFMTGSAITIIASQLPALIGVSGFSNRDSPYLVVINTVKHLPDVKADAAMGLTALFALYLIRFCLARAAMSFPSKKRIFFFMSTMRTVVIIVLYTFISWLVNMHRREAPAFRVLGDVPKGFRHAGIPQIPSGIISHLASHLPVTVIVMLAEHVAISKSFGRINNYTIDPSQEMVAIGFTNLLGPFLGAYPTTGSFSRTAVNSAAGVRTPAGGLVSGLLVLVATYFLTGVFHYIPNAALSAVIIHAVGDLITPPNSVYQFWRVSPLEVVIFLVSVLVTVFRSIEDGLYVTVCSSLIVLLYRILKERGRFLGRVRVHSVVGDHVVGDDRKLAGNGDIFDDSVLATERDVFLPLHHEDGSNPELEIESPYPGIFIFRFSGMNYSNASSTLDHMSSIILRNTRRSSPVAFKRPGDRPWNHAGSREQSEDDYRPTLQAIILDLSSVNSVDVTSIQCLVDVRKQLDQHASPDVVDWHIACISSRWTKRALASAGFGVPTDRTGRRWQPMYSVAQIGYATERQPNKTQTRVQDVEMGTDNSDGTEIHSSSSLETAVADEKGAIVVSRPRYAEAAVYGRDKPLFHVDLTSALQSAIANVEARREFRPGETVGGGWQTLSLRPESGSPTDALAMPWGFERVNSKTSQPNANIVFIKPLKGPDEKTAQEFLERIAAQCVPIMRKHHLYVMALEEFEPNREFVGRNFNAGEVIQLVLKSRSSGRWLPFEYVQMVMMHELAHCKQMNHSRAFWTVRNGYAEEMRRLWNQGYTGDGIWGRGTKLATGAWEKDMVRSDEILPEHLCGGTFRTRRGKSTKKRPAPSYREREDRRIRRKFGENGTVLGADEEVKTKLERGKRVQAKPRVANSERGRQLRAAAALARFDKGKEESAKTEDTEGVSESGDEGLQDAAAVDGEGNPLLDCQGRELVKVCEDEDVNDVDARGELDELRHVFRKGRVKEEEEEEKKKVVGEAKVKQENEEEEGDDVDDDEPPVTEGIGKHAGEPSKPVGTRSCSACSFINMGLGTTCAMCANVLEPERTAGTWRCGSGRCASYANSADSGVCGLCGGTGRVI
ncbi:hypothetical protein L249_3412 [Ophiocordyceps polyrhachis-furcata BCC 54312]|uniref:STAS domain-containing protein n=1 Tax=Ophiocordyceps polyrhachis-furcata BCC 54312 TaxID=1330021 RepID=A0A367LM36_9HYPO|nr:hypothetical protein L249_3412 [Ophiocordyceps polyrhachis-furcata BCC 54312]